MDREAARRAVRESISCKDYLEKSKGGLYCCPYCGSGHGANATGAVKLYQNNTWYCFACGKRGDVIDLYRQRYGADYSTALSLLANEIGISVDPYRPGTGAAFPKMANKAPAGGPRSDFPGRGSVDAPPEKASPQNAAERPAEENEGEKDYTRYYLECRAQIKDPAAAAYLQGRGISLETAEAYWIGFDPSANPAYYPGALSRDPEKEKAPGTPRLIIPTSKSHYIARSIDPAASVKVMNPARSQAAIFNERALYAQDAQEVFITEGAFDALSILEAGAPAISTNSAANAEALIKHLERRPPSAKVLILALDNDGPGEKATQKITDGLRRLGICFIDRRKEISGKYKDPNEYWQKEREALEGAIAQAREDARAAAAQPGARVDSERQRRTGAGMVDSFLTAIKSRKYEPVPTGIRDIDSAIGGGFIRQQLILLGAAPGAGKTALAQWVFEGMAKRGTSCLYLNLEMSREQILARSLSRIAKNNGYTIRPVEVLQGYRWTIEQEEAIATAAEEYRREIAPQMIYNPDEVTADLDSILAYIEKEGSAAAAAGNPAPLVVLDYLQIITGGPREDDAAVIKRAVSSLKSYAIRYNSVVFVIMAHNREANRTGIVTMESGRDTSALEYSADLQLGLTYTRCLSRDGQKGKPKDELTPEERRLVTLKITKGRFAAAGAEIDLAFNGETMTYTQLSADDAQAPAKRSATITI